MLKKIITLTLLSAGSLAGIQAQSFKEKIEAHREIYLSDFINQKNPPLNAEDLKNLHFFDADSSYLVKAGVTILQNERSFKMPTFDGTTKDFIRYARVKFDLGGKNFEMTLFISPELMKNPALKNYLFLPFSDPSNGITTYGGGRYIDLRTDAIVNGQIEIDFNKAYNPYCAYSNGYRCPVPPDENRLSIAVSAGEKKYIGKRKTSP